MHHVLYLHEPRYTNYALAILHISIHHISLLLLLCDGSTQFSSLRGTDSDDSMEAEDNVERNIANYLGYNGESEYDEKDNAYPTDWKICYGLFHWIYPFHEAEKYEARKSDCIMSYGPSRCLCLSTSLSKTRLLSTVGKSSSLVLPRLSSHFMLLPISG